MATRDDETAQARMALPQGTRNNIYPVQVKRDGRNSHESRWCVACGASINDRHVAGCVHDDGLGRVR